MEPVTIPPVTDNKEPVINVIMKIIFVILLLILIGEPGNLFIHKSKNLTTYLDYGIK